MYSYGHPCSSYICQFIYGFYRKKFTYPRNHRPRIWFRFVDDVWGIFHGTELELKQFVEYCNSVHDSIKFTIEYSKVSVNFLDIITYISNGRINSTLYVKPTDTHSYLDYKSCHPQSNKSSIPYSQFLQIRRNTTEWTEFIRHSVKLYIDFSQYGYPHKLVNSSLHRANKCTQLEVLSNSRNPDSTKDNTSFSVS